MGFGQPTPLIKGVNLHPLIKGVWVVRVWCRRLSLLHPHFFLYQWAYRSPKDRPNKGGIAEKLAPEAYRAIGASHE